MATCRGSAERAVTRLPFFLILIATFLAAGCSKSTTAPGQTTLPPRISCPAAPPSVVSTNNVSAPVTYGTPVVNGGQVPLTTACAPVSGASFPIGSNTVSCTTSDSLMRTDSCTFSVVVTRSPQISLTRFVAFGDSITWGEDGSVIDGPGQCPADLAGSGLALRSIRARVQVALDKQYPTQLQTDLRNLYVAQASSISVANAGNSGQRAGDPNAFCCEPDGRDFTTEVLSGNFQAVLIMEGANDLPNISSAIDGLRHMVEAARNAAIRPYLATIPPEEILDRPNCERGGNAPYVTSLNDQIKALAAQEGVTLVDVYAAFPLGDVIALGLIGHDGLHPTPSGYSVIANAFFQALKSTLEVH